MSKINIMKKSFRMHKCSKCNQTQLNPIRKKLMTRIICIHCGHEQVLTYILGSK